jgi:DnaJ-class molecular chaperone
MSYSNKIITFNNLILYKTMSKNYYKILEISPSANEQEIKKQYRKLALKYHPDKPGGNETMFKEVLEAYGVLSDSTEKQNYDKAQRQGIEYHAPSSVNNRIDSGRNDIGDEISFRGRAVDSIINYHPRASSILEDLGY